MTTNSDIAFAIQCMETTGGNGRFALRERVKATGVGKGEAEDIDRRTLTMSRDIGLACALPCSMYRLRSMSRNSKTR